VAAMADDLNTPRAIAELHRSLKASREGTADLVEKMTKVNERVDASSFMPSRQLWAGLEFLGIDIANYDPDWRQKHATSELSVEQTAKIKSLIESRTAARKAKNFAESDRIRDELAAMGVVLKDSKDGTTWEIAR